jgi:tetratricopeptide (TPR) repeat protein
MDAAYRALEVEPNYADGLAQLTAVLLTLGRHQEGLQAIQKAMRLNPRHPFYYIAINGRAHFALGDYAAAAAAFERALERNPDFIVARRELAASYAHLGRIEDAEWEAQEILALEPGFSLSRERRRVIFRKGDDMDRYIAGLRKAGLPE